ncbi:proline dehydrogenase family protein [Nocardia farcinica]|uniref:proline dehydrogenase family protein n=1 Tax=Nocardia farcinica TaxID=37329 RepID=UPI0015F001C4|nr:proline dehydrogenase family protein [Nocardia farcinica]MBA4855514.1 proline dehydrogenase family protein [Nocardia farcinica]MBC9818147.1 proline dehydrogenase family protein [Nocardia farcinica]MBF6249893.1 proline dehydrogenase family protein [Nocardia farcinica]MBF6418787.1 proline dehydrogenase family protein [Nocardia farcinica]MBF6430264.1 proline dehydrogenase family protein [Nocardia farcinica]
MSGFTRLLRPALLAAAASPRVERTVTSLRATRALVDRFVAGTTEADALGTVEALLASGRWITVDHLGEHTTDLARARDTVAHYRRLLAALAELPAAGAPGTVRPLEVSVKLSALGQALPGDGAAIALDHAREICTAASAAGIGVTVDAEDHTTTDATLAVVRELRADFPGVGTVLQAYLRRTEGDCREFAGPGSRIRLCKGAYREPASVAFQRAAEVDDSYRRCLRILMSGRGYPMVASHDPAMLAEADRLAAETGRGPDDFEYQMLFGIRDAEQRRLADAGHRMRVYVPYGDQWYGYFMRRLAERPANLAFFLRAAASRDRA